MIENLAETTLFGYSIAFMNNSSKALSVSDMDLIKSPASSENAVSWLLLNILDLCDDDKF